MLENAADEEVNETAHVLNAVSAQPRQRAHPGYGEKLVISIVAHKYWLGKARQ
jgi:hypothetical protein